MRSLWIGYLDDEVTSLDRWDSDRLVAVEVLCADLRVGRNCLVLPRDRGSAVAWRWRGRGARFDVAVPFAAGMLTRSERSASDALSAAMRQAMSDVWSPSMRPVVCGVDVGGTCALYAFTDETAFDTSALRFADGPLPFDGTAEGFLLAVARSREQFAKAGPQINTGRGYVQWRPEFEMERKFTYRDPPDIWGLAVRMYRDLADGRCAGFAPEPHLGFQVFDYDNYLFDVVAPPAEAGYISFIPQVDGRVTVKRKWFEANAEIRRESLWRDQSIDPQAFAETARRRVDGDVVELPPFRRTRFDINYESLHSGNVIGVYFDTCRAISRHVDRRFGQVEVEYCRSRTLLPIVDVMADFEALCQHTREYLTSSDVPFEQNLYSKLDFCRELGRALSPA